MKVEVKLSGLDGVLDTLKSLPAEVVSHKGGPVRSALAKGARVIRDEARRRLQAAIDEPGESGITDSTGFTVKNVIAVRKAPRGGNGERFIVTVRPKIHPTGGSYNRKSRRSAGSKRRARDRKDITIKANDIAFFLEYGTSTQPATPWIRPAFSAKAEEAIRTVERELLAGINRVVAKLAKGKR